MSIKRRYYLNTILEKVINDYDKKIKTLILEEEYPCECEIIHNMFKIKVEKMIHCSKYEELILKIKEYEELNIILERIF